MPVSLPANDLNQNEDPAFCYVLIRNDAPDYNVGKMAAQVHHNGCEMVADLPNASEAIRNLYMEWCEDRQFGVAITLGCTYAQMRQIVTIANEVGLHSKITHDPTYPIFDGDKYHTLPIDTCAYVFGRRSMCQTIIGDLKLFGK